MSRPQVNVHPGKIEGGVETPSMKAVAETEIALTSRRDRVSCPPPLCWVDCVRLYGRDSNIREHVTTEADCLREISGLDGPPELSASSALRLKKKATCVIHLVALDAILVHQSQLDAHTFRGGSGSTKSRASLSCCQVGALSWRCAQRS